MHQRLKQLYDNQEYLNELHKAKATYLEVRKQQRNKIRKEAIEEKNRKEKQLKDNLKAAETAHNLAIDEDNRIKSHPQPKGTWIKLSIKGNPKIIPLLTCLFEKYENTGFEKCKFCGGSGRGGPRMMPIREMVIV